MPTFRTPFTLLVVFLATLTLSPASGLESKGINENDAVIEFDASDDFFMLLSANESSTVHLYSRKDVQYLSKRKAFRQAAKRDIDRALAEGCPMTQWISIDKEVLSKKASPTDGYK